MRLPSCTLLVLLLACVACPVVGQGRDEPRPVPIFSPPEGAQRRPATEEAQPAPVLEQQRPAAVPGSPEAVAILIDRLRRWPAPGAREAADQLARTAGPAHAALIAGLGNNDWRVRSGCANALATMVAKDAVPALVAAIADPSNRAGLDELFRALVSLDPEGAPATLLPFLSQGNGRLREEALAAFPPLMPQAYRSDLVRILGEGRPMVRQSALELLSRMPGPPDRAMYTSLGDPEAAVADFAARHLALRHDPQVRKQLLDRAEKASRREAAFAALALARDELDTGGELIPAEGAVRDRFFRMLPDHDPFLRGTACVVLAGLAFRHEDADLTRLADEYLVPMMLRVVAGGTFFPEYTALEDLCFRRIEVLTGRKFGRDAHAWKEWWMSSADGFHARRRLGSLSAEDLRTGLIIFTRREAGGSRWRAAFTADPAVLDDPTPGAGLVVFPEGARELARWVVEAGLFEGHPDALPTADEASTELTVRVGSREATWVATGEDHARLGTLAGHLERLRAELGWQRLLEVPEGSTRRAAGEALAASLAGLPDDAARSEAVVDIALKAWKRTRGADRALCLFLFERAGPAWVTGQRASLAALLVDETHLTEDNGRLVSLLARDGHPSVQERLLDIVADAPGARARRLLDEVLASRSHESLVALLDEDRPTVRCAVARALAAGGLQEDAALLVGRLRDRDPEVRDAILEALRSWDRALVLAALGAALEADDEELRVRCWEALAAVGAAESADRLWSGLSGASDVERWAILRGLQQAGGVTAADLIVQTVRAPGPLEFRREALDTLTRLDPDIVREPLRALLGLPREDPVLPLAVASYARVAGEAGVPDLLPILAWDAPEIRRTTALSLGQLGAREALATLLALVQEPEGDRAAERALEVLTFHMPEGPTAGARAQAFVAWADVHAQLTREEWFLLAAGEAGIALDPDLTWLDREGSPARLPALARLLTQQNAALRAQADRLLLPLSGLALRPLGPDATETEYEDRASVYRARFEL